VSRLTDLQQELQDASAAIAHAERTVSAHPGVASVAATLRTIQKRRERLEEEFFAVTNEMGLDVCGYRIELDDRPATIAALTGVLATFQKVFTGVYDALVRGPKLTSKTSAETTDATAFGFAYTFPGSVGVMMTLPNERLLLGATKLDEAMDTTLELLSASDPEKVQGMTAKVGLPAVRFAHQWAIENAKAGYGADIAWIRNSEVRRELRLQPPQIAKLASSIKGVTAKEEVVVIGELLDVKLSDHTFSMKVKDKTIFGQFTDAIGASHPALLPKTYRAVLHVMQKVVVEDGKEEITYFLLRLDEPTGEQTLFLSELPK